jgi:uncharacterized protein YegP (UPF0339 family)
MASPKFVIYEKTGVALAAVDGNNETIATSEPYGSKSHAVRGAENMKKTAPVASIETQ